jgi:hypothetical protein
MSPRDNSDGPWTQRQSPIRLAPVGRRPRFRCSISIGKFDSEAFAIIVANSSRLSTAKPVRQPFAMSARDVWEMPDDEMPELAFAGQDSRKRAILEAFGFAMGSRKWACEDDDCNCAHLVWV